MHLLRNSSPKKDVKTYSLDEAADFLEFDRRAVEYWLRMGHLNGFWDQKERCWRIRPADLVAFLQESNEPLPTGWSWRVNQVDPETMDHANPVPSGAVPAGDELTQ